MADGHRWPPVRSSAPVQGQVGKPAPHVVKKTTQREGEMETTPAGKTELHPGLLDELLEDLRSATSKWKQIGRKLGIPHDQLDVIREDCMQRGGVSDCFTTMLNKWLHSTKESRNEIWIIVCKALMKIEEIRLASIIARKHDVSPRIEKQPQDQHTVLGGTVTFRCEARTSGFQITYKWMHTRDGTEVKVKVASAELSIEGVTEGHRGKYRCIVKNEFDEEKSQPAELIIGKELNSDDLRRILNREGIEDTAWPEIGECLGQDLQSTFIGGIIVRIQEFPFDKKDLWQKIAQNLEGMEAAAQKNAGKDFNESTVIELFKEAEIKDTVWCKIYEELEKPWERFEEKRNTEHTHNDSENCSVDTIFKHKNITWEKLAKALDGIQGYESAAEKIKDECTEEEITDQSLNDVFTDASKVKWHQVAEIFPKFNKSCLIEVLTRWLSQQKGKDPWMYWRKLAASVESLKEDSEDPKEVKHQLGIGYKLRLRFGVGLALNKDNLFKVLTEAGIKDWNVVVSGLKLDPHWIKRVAQALASPVQTFTALVRKPQSAHEQVLDKWPMPQSWEELARAINDSEGLKKTGPEIAQKTRQLSGSGGFPKIHYLYSDPKLKSKNVKSETTVTFKCEARGAPPLKYTWMCGDKELSLPDSRTVKFKVKSDGLYNCRVENDFGSCTSEYPLELVLGDAPTCRFADQQKKNFQTGCDLSLHCIVSGSVPLQYTWLHDGDELQKGDEPQKCDGLDLEIKQVKLDAAGEYQCRVTNAFASVTSTIKIKVGDPPQIKSIGFEGPEKVHYERGVTLKFYCKATGAPAYIWRRLKGSLVTEVGYEDRLEIETKEDTEGQYTCQVKNDFGDITSKPPIEIKVGDQPIVNDPPKRKSARPNVVTGEQVQLTCAVEGNGLFEYVWIHDNQTLVKKTGSCDSKMEAELCIEEMTAADQGEYKCRFINSYGFCVSEPISLHLGIELEELMKQLCTPISPMWCMFGILLDVKKSILDRISRGFVANGNVEYSLQEVIVSWLEIKHNPQRPHSWATIQDVVQRMGNKKLAEDIGSKQTTPASSTENKTEELAKYDAKDMRILFENLAGKVEKMLATPDSSDTESGSTRRSADAVVSGIRASLHLIQFKDEEIQEITDRHSVIKILRQYLNYQRYHLLEKVIVQFGSEEAQTEMRDFTDKFSIYQATTLLGNFVPLKQPEESPVDDHSKSEGDPHVKNPPFAHSLKIMLESQWATCTLRDAENLLVNLLPDTVSREFVWFSTSYRAEKNLVCLEYLVSPQVIELLKKEIGMRKKTLSSMGIHCVQVHGTDFKTESSITRAHTEEQGAAVQLLMQKLDEYKDEAPQRRIKKIRIEQASETETMHQDPQETESKQDSEEIEALRTALEETKMAFEDTRTALEKALEDTRTALDDTRNSHDQEIKALQQKIESLKRNTTAVTLHQKDKGLLEASIKSIKEAMSAEIEGKLTVRVASLESDMDLKIRQGIRKHSKPAPTRSLLDSVSSPTEIVSPGSTGERIGEDAPENDRRSQEQRQAQEPLDAASILKEIREAVREELQCMESRMRGIRVVSKED